MFRLNELNQKLFSLYIGENKYGTPTKIKREGVISNAFYIPNVSFGEVITV